MDEQSRKQVERDKTTDFIRAHWWHIGALMLAIAGGHFKITNLEQRVDAIERNGPPPIRERLQSIESQSQFVSHRIESLESDTKQSAVLFADFKSKLDVLGVKIDNIAEWVKEQKKKEKL